MSTSSAIVLLIASNLDHGLQNKISMLHQLLYIDDRRWFISASAPTRSAWQKGIVSPHRNPPQGRLCHHIFSLVQAMIVATPYLSYEHRFRQQSIE